MPGSIGAAPFPIWKIEPADDQPAIESATCLLPMVEADTWFLFRLHRYYNRGILLTSGGIMEQPAAYIQTMEYIDESLNHG